MELHNYLSNEKSPHPEDSIVVTNSCQETSKTSKYCAQSVPNYYFLEREYVEIDESRESQCCDGKFVT